MDLVHFLGDDGLAVCGEPLGSNASYFFLDTTCPKCATAHDPVHLHQLAHKLSFLSKEEAAKEIVAHKERFRVAIDTFLAQLNQEATQNQVDPPKEETWRDRPPLL